jgi:hypothetical protein
MSRKTQEFGDEEGCEREMVIAVLPAVVESTWPTGSNRAETRPAS